MRDLRVQERADDLSALFLSSIPYPLYLCLIPAHSRWTLVTAASASLPPMLSASPRSRSSPKRCKPKFSLATIRILRNNLREMRNSPILDALLPLVRSGILTRTFARPSKEWYLSELAKSLKTQPSSLQRELRSLVKAGILRQRREGRRVYFQPDTESPVYPDLKALIEKTSGLVPTLRLELHKFRERIQIAFIYGSIARSEEDSQSDVDLMIVGSAGLADLSPALRQAEKKLARPVNPTVYSPKEFASRIHAHDHFLTSVLSGTKQFVKGDEHELAAMVGRA